MNLFFLNATNAQTTEPARAGDVSSRPISSGKSPQRMSTARPLLPAPPQIAKLSVVVTQFGAVPNDGTDDTVAIQTAIDTIAQKGGGSVMFPPGTYRISIQRQGKHLQALKLRSRVRLAASTTKGATLKLADRQGNYESLMGTAEYSTPLTDFVIAGLTIDSNGQHNPVLRGESNGRNSPDFGDDQTALPRAAVRVYTGKRIRIDRTRFTNQNAVWSVVVNGTLEGMTDVAITNSRFDNVGGNAVDFDHSSIYTQGARMLLDKNVFVSRSGPGTKGARTAIEIHGNDQTVIGNTITGYANGINVTGVGTPVSQRQLYQDNRLDDVNTGFTLWFGIHPGTNPALPALQNVTLRRNTVNINSTNWLRSGVAGSQGPSAGIMLDPNSNASIQDLTIADNRITFVNAQPVTYEHDRFSGGIVLWKYTHPNAPIDRLTIAGNRIVNAPGAGIWSNAALGGAGSSSIANNTIVNPARSYRLAEDNSGASRAAIYLQANSKNRNLRIHNNTIVDTLEPTRLKYGIVANSACTGSCGISQNIVKASTSIPVRANVSWGVRPLVPTRLSTSIDVRKILLSSLLLLPIVKRPLYSIALALVLMPIGI
ncbi:glycosyl hydrolase family 28-related protein [Chamaesiphon sp.]|uniref:glycosyl hydrolase family 28-related protein n=1 Tax=Chamaesiphon sp. TaxID=2814140 RepID=UPI003593BD5F